MALPVVADWGGLLYRPIEAVEGALGADNPDRLGRPRNQATWSVWREGGSGFTRTGPGAGLGDAWLALKARLLEEGAGRPALSLRLACSLPTGRLPWGAGAVVPAVGLLAGTHWGSLALRASVDLAIPTAPLPQADLATHPYGTANLGVTIPAGRALAVQVQASAHGAPVHDTGLSKLDSPTYYLLLGLGIRLDDAAALDVALVENVWSPYRGADLTFVVAVHGL